MTTKRIRKVMVSLPLLVAPLPFLMLGCGGNSTAPAASQTTTTNPAPAVLISGASTATATGPVTFTFTFSEPVATFPASAVTVTGGTAAAATTKLSPNQYTLVVTPPTNATGTISVTVAAGAFSDTAGMASTAQASVTQAFNTVVQVLTYTIMDFNGTLPSGETYTATDFGGEASTLVSTGVPAGGPTNTVLQTIKTAGAQTWAGTSLSVGYDFSIPQVPLSATASIIKVQVYAPAAGTDFLLKLEDATNSSNSVQTDALSTVAGWQTLTFDFTASTANSTPLVATFTYDKLSIFPDFNTAPTAAETFYIGPITFVGASAPLAPALSAPGSNQYTILDFNTALPSGETYNYNDFNGDATTLVSSGYPTTGLPAGTGPQVAQIVTPAVSGSAVYNGTFLGVGYENTVGALPFFASTTATAPQATKVSVVLYAPAAGVDIKLKIQNAGNTGQSVETDQTTVQGWQTYVFDFSTPATGTAALNATFTYNNPILFLDFAATAATSETYYVGPITFIGESAPLSAPLVNPNLGVPATAAPTPSLASSKVIALYDSSSTYTVDSAVTVTPAFTWSAGWGADTFSMFAINGSVSVLEYASLQYAGVQLSSNLDVSKMTTMHVDLWTPNATEFGVQLVSFSGGGPLSGAGQINFTSSTITDNGWVSLEIPLANFQLPANIVNGTAAGMDLSAIGQILWLDNIGGTEQATFYLDNVYFHD